MFPLPNNRFHFLNNGIPFDLHSNQIDSIRTFLNLDISTKQVNLNLNISSFCQKTTILSTEEVYLLVSIFNPYQVRNILNLYHYRDEKENQIFQLNIPLTVNVRIEYSDFDKYTIYFADYIINAAEKLCLNVKNN